MNHFLVISIAGVIYEILYNCIAVVEKQLRCHSFVIYQSYYVLTCTKTLQKHDCNVIAI
jgi:hypothetical protein